MAKKVSIVVSAYNEEKNLGPLYEQIVGQLKSVDVDYEIILVNDGSSDKTLNKALEIRKTNPKFKVLNFRRNYGHELAMTAGMDYASGDAVIFMDADLQHPPELIPKMSDAWINNYKIVLTIRDKNYDVSTFHKINTFAYTRIFNQLSDVELLRNSPDFRLIDRSYVDFLKKFREGGRLFRGLLGLIIGHDSEEVYLLHFDAPKRIHGKTKYNFVKKIRLALDSIIQFSIVPLRLATYLGIIAIVFSMFLAGFVVIEYFVYNRPSTGYSTIMVTMLFLGSVQLISLGIIGEYIGKIHLEVKKRPLYLADFFDDNNERR